MHERGNLHNKSSGPSHYGATHNSEPTAASNSTPEIHIHSHGWRFMKYKYRKPFAEFLGTFILCVFGIGSIAQTLLSGHLNPAVTITLAVYRKFPWIQVPMYIFAQTLGAFIAAAVVYVNYYAALKHYDGVAINKAGIFATYPADFMNPLGSFFSEAIGTFFLVLIILAATDDVRNTSDSKPLAPITIGIGLLVIAISFGYETGFALNPARDFGPRFFTFLVGYGTKVFSASNFYFWIPLVAPVVGGLVAGFVYDSLIYWGESPLNHNV
ncbi:9020_t:CDS:2 [Diversispora eburnea]|uniref:9020_t:CDS:1 n=1 Tax=Diversispora eburnea TaxID=1213867 RepID=A0A9N8YLD1_9GLOM|nr:9020_t:CDS:2 [Diversispora eburnea]